MPLLVRHKFEGEIARATNDYYVAQDALAKVIAAARADDLRATQDLDAARVRLGLLETTQATQVEDVLRAAETGYARGALGVLDVLDARRAARQVRLDILAARADAARAALARWWWDQETMP
jgi:cobalt-zinc-cadmium efflux system outer membrane protein